MPLEQRKNSKWWYGVWKINNQRLCVNLGVEIKRTPPEELKKGDADEVFDLCKATAQAKLDRLVEEARSKSTAEQHLEKLYEIKTGEKIGSIALKDMAAAWDRIPVKRKRSPRYIQLAHSIIASFVSFVADKYPKVRTLADVRPKIARAYLLDIETTRAQKKSPNLKTVPPDETPKTISGRTWNSKLILLRSVFHGLARDAGIAANPFDDIPTREEDTIHRQPYNEEQLKAILAASDDFIRPIIITGMCTAMRLSDCCLLKWKDVDLDQGFVVVKTSKTGETAEIPLFPMLRGEITAQKKTDSPYVFSEQAAEFIRYRHTFSRATRRVLKKAGIETHSDRQNGTNKASVHGFHSFRTTWITLALSAGVPMELVRRVTGHSTVDVVLKHYFRPGRQEFQKALQDAMPRLLTAGPVESAGAQQTTKLTLSDVRGLAERMNPRNWKQIREDILAGT